MRVIKKSWCNVKEIRRAGGKLKPAKNGTPKVGDREQVSLSYFDAGAKAIFSAGSLFGVQPH